MAETTEQLSDDRSAEEADDNQPRLSARAKHILLGSILLIAAVVLAWFIYHELRGRYYQSTNDAQLQADSVAIAPRTSGYVAEVLVADNQDVTSGQPLVRIDPRDYKAQAAQATAQVGVAQASIENARATIAEQHSAVVQAEARLASAQAKAAHDAAEVARFAPLAAAGAEPRDNVDKLRIAAVQSAKDVTAQAAALDMARQRIRTIETQVRQGEAQQRAAEAQLAAADVDLRATLIRAPITGRVGDRTVVIGQYTQAGTRLMSIVPLQHIYVVANFKETQIGLMRPGQPATVKVDALGGIELHGHVESLTPGTGAKFSLLPPENATGNFTKIVQRVPVRIAIDPGPEARRLLVPGLSVTVTVDTISAKGAKDRIRDEQKQLEAARS